MNRLAARALATASLLAAPVVAVPAVASATVLPYNPGVLEARVAFGSNFNWENGGGISGVSLNDAGVLGIRGSVTRGSGYFAQSEDALWYGAVGLGGSIYRNTGNPGNPGTALNLPFVASNNVAYTFQRGGNTDAPQGFYAFNGVNYSLVTSNIGGINAFNVGAYAFSAGQLAFVDTTSANRRIRFNANPGPGDSYVDIYTAPVGTTFLNATFARNLTAAFHTGGGENPTIIATATSSGVVTTVATVGAGYNSFLASPYISSNGQYVAFRGTDSSGTAVVGLSDGVTTTNIVTQGGSIDGNEIPTLASFGPRVSNSGHVAFLTGAAPTSFTLWVTDGSELIRVVGVGDVLMTDLGERAVTSINGNVFDFNGEGVVAIGLALQNAGSGVFTFTPIPEPASLSLLALGGLGLLARRRRA